MKIQFLNKEVEAEVIDDEMLYVVYTLRHAFYDDETDPVHNPDWVKKQSELEVKFLNETVRCIEECKKLYRARGDK